MIINDRQKQNITSWIIEELNLPGSACVNIEEQRSNDSDKKSISTKITVTLNNKHEKTFSIAKPINRIEKEDIKAIRIHAGKSLMEKYPFLGKILRFFGLWIAFSGLYAMFAVCPFCGQSGCPVGAGGAGFIGIFFAIFFQFLDRWITSLKAAVSRFFNKNKALDKK